MSGMRYQPQGLARLRPNISGAQSIILASTGMDVVSRKPIVFSASNPPRAVTPSGIGIGFRKNGWVQSDPQPDIGTQTFVEFWVGYPSSDYGNYGNGDNDPTFLTGSSVNNTAIVGKLGSIHAANGDSTSWGALYRWSDIFNSANDVLTPGKLTVLVVVRRQTGMELWRDGRLRNFVSQTPISLSGSTFMLGAFIANDYWRSSSTPLLAGRIVADWGAEQIQSFCANPWKIFESPEDEYDDFVTTVSTGYVDVVGFSGGSSSVTAIARAVSQAYGSSNGSTGGSATGRAVTSTAGNGNGASTADAAANGVVNVIGNSTGASLATVVMQSVFEIKGAGAGVSTASALAFSITQAFGSASGKSDVQASAVTVACTNGSSQGTATLQGNAVSVWHVAGNAGGVSAVAGYSDSSQARVIFDTSGLSYGSSSATASAKALANATGNAPGVGTAAAKANAVSNAAGSATGTSFVVAGGQTLISAIGAALGASNASGSGAMVISATGSAVAASGAGAQGRAVVGTDAKASGASVAQSATIVIYETVAKSLNTSTVQGVVDLVIQAVGKANGFATVSGTTEGGVHYTASGDKFSVTITFAPYAVSVENKPYTITFN